MNTSNINKARKIFLQNLIFITLILISPVNVNAEVSPKEIYPTRGNRTAEVSLIEFSDFQCPFCTRIVPTLQRLIDEYPEDLNWVFRHYPLRETPGQGSFKIHEASVCAQDQGKFWEFHDAVFKKSVQQKNRTLQWAVETAGMDIKQYEACMQEESTRARIFEDLKEGQYKGIRGTPSVFIGPYVVSGAYPYEYFKQLVDYVLNPDEVVPPEPLVEWGSVPKIAEFNDLNGRPAKGPENAPITLVEFSDFHCPFCKKLAPVFSELMTAHKGKIRQVWRHYPLNIHPRAGIVHLASECAHEQGKFWEFHEILMAPKKVSDNQEGLKTIAKRLGLNMSQFEGCLESDKYKEQIEMDIIAGRKSGVQGTPTIFINGKRIVGAFPFKHYDSLIKDELKSKN